MPLGLFAPIGVHVGEGTGILLALAEITLALQAFVDALALERAFYCLCYNLVSPLGPFAVKAFLGLRPFGPLWPWGTFGPRGPSKPFLDLDVPEPLNAGYS